MSTDTNPRERAVTRRSLLATVGGTLTAGGALAAIPTAAAEPMEWAQNGTAYATQITLQLFGPESEQLAQTASEAALEGIAQQAPDAPEALLTESVCSGTAYGSVIGTTSGVSITGVQDPDHVQAAAQGAAAGGIATVAQYDDDYFSFDGTYARPGYIDVDGRRIELLPEGQGMITDTGPFMRIPTSGAATGALQRPFLVPDQTPETTYWAAFTGVNAGATYYLETGISEGHTVASRAGAGAIYYQG